MVNKQQADRKHHIRIILLLVGIISVSVITFTLTSNRKAAFAQDTLDLPGINLVPVASGFTRPIHITHAGDGSGRLFIVEQSGKIYWLVDERSQVLFLDIEERVESPASGGGNEEGLLSLAFPPGYAEKGYFYVYYTMRTGDNVLARFYHSDGPDMADPDSEEQILILPHPEYRNHNGGQIAFGPDGYLYIGTGDGGGGGDPLGYSQDPSSLNGKLLRIDVEGGSGSVDPQQKDYSAYPKAGCKDRREVNEAAYVFPGDNPFIQDQSYRPEIWALGLRNPWRFSFDRESGDLYIADVGQNRWEEINFQAADSPGGQNYGWNVMEGEECYGGNSCDAAGLTLPVQVYPIFSSSDCSITGGFVYRGEAFPELDGIYIYGDFCTGNVWGLQPAGDEWLSGRLVNSGFRISSFGEDQDGEIYLADMAGGGIYQIALP